MPKESWLFLFAAIGAIHNLTQFAMWLREGRRMTTKRKQQQQPVSGVWISRRKLYAMMLSIVVTLGLSLWGLYSTVTTTQAKPSASLVPILNLHQPVFVEGKPTLINVGFRNAGPTPVTDLEWDARLLLERRGLSDRDEGVMFDEFVAKSTPRGVGSAAIVGQTGWVTLQTPVLSALDAQDLREGRLHMYVLRYVRYRDSHGAWEARRCDYLQEPGDKPIWHGCKSNNTIQPQSTTGGSGR